MPKVKRTLTDFYNTDFKEYALYTIHSRAIPGLLDGMKPVHRKVMWTAKRKARSPIKTVSLAAYVLAEADYKHGDMSVIESVVKMASSWRHHLPLLEGHGNFGWRMVPDAGAPRYTKVRLSPNFHEWFSDFNALKFTPGDDDGLYEPDCYYSNVPWFLIDGFRGVATGYSSFCHPRKPSNIVKLITDILDGRVPDESCLDISYPEYTGTIEGEYSIGKWRQKTKKKIVIESLPVNYNVDTYSKKLVKLVDKGVIRDFHKTLAENEPPFMVDLKEPLRDPEKTLGLRHKLISETFVFIHDHKLLMFDNIWDVIGKFIEERIKIAGAGIKQSRVTKEDIISRIATKIRFVSLVRECDMDSLSRADLNRIIDKLPRQDMRDTLLAMAVTKLTDDKIEVWKEQIQELTEEINILNQVTPVQWLKYNILNKPLS
jgi:DNA topoisomerase-2